MREPSPPPQPYVQDDTAIRTLRVRNDPHATNKLDTTAAIDIAVDHLGRAADDWELDSTDQPNDYTVTLQFTRL